MHKPPCIERGGFSVVVISKKHYKSKYLACYTNGMKRWRKHVAILLSLILLAATSGCSAPSDTVPAETPAPTQIISSTPSPSPTPQPEIAVLGADQSETFLEGVEQAAKDGPYAIKVIADGTISRAPFQPPGVAAVIVYLEGNHALPNTDLPIYVFSADGTSLPTGIAGLTYLPRGTEQAALDEAISYPPHLAPVRMIGLFSSATSEAYAVWSRAVAKGQVFSKREYIADTNDELLDDWLPDMFSRYFSGMLDAIYAENGALAVAAAEKLASLGRDDVQVFSASTDADALRSLSMILVCAVGTDFKAAGTRCYTEAVKLLSGQKAQSDKLSPEIFWYSPKP